jgi:protein SCO1/2
VNMLNVNQRGFRFLGIALGLVVGTIAALATHSIRKSLWKPSVEDEKSFEAMRSSLPKLGRLGGGGHGSDDQKAGASDANGEDSEGEGTEVRQESDPGMRRQLAQLREAAKQEPNWTRSFELIERSGTMVRSEELKGEPYVVCFFFSTCPGTCKRQSSEMRLLQGKFKGQPIRLVSISVDPDVDTPEVLATYAEGFNADPKQWLFLTGKLDDIIRVGTEMYFLPGVERRGHPDRFCLVDAQGDLVGSYVWLDEEERELLVKHIEELLAAGRKTGGEGETSSNP